ncbi:Ig-like domain-containing protein [Flavobacterium gilvum]|uniref:Ig-like domain-containing protein n=1 Tax=Flavobacterium gilvum TaxID=1492737 RepID=A0AAC9N7S3_9FLAO|nr:T9SS type B sorting domain-containing protein [Flavobacterium gilvum]AOW10978.1 hypothetical protein EM308_16630 [Flavobacterium gilvum]KFC57884.1 hypothetical protein FEM08_33460 [Flavobacterium gilvum]
MPQNYKSIKYSIVIAFFFFINSNAQVIQWQNTIGGDNYEWPTFIELANDGNYISGGYSFSDISRDKTENSRGFNDFWLIKIDDTSGNLLWQKTIGGIDNDYLVSAKETTDGGYILGGYSSSPISGEKTQNSRGYDDYWVVRLDANRNIKWDKTYGGSGVDRLTSIIQTDDGGYLIGGSSDSNISGEKSENSRGNIDMWVIKIDASGNIIWQKTFGGSNLDWVQSMIKTPDGGYILAGSSHSNISGDKTQNSRGFGDYWILKIDAIGNIIWQKTIGGNNGDYAKSIITTSDGNYIIGGDSSSNISGEKSENTISNSPDVWLVKIDNNGQLLWQKNIGGNNTESFENIRTTSDNGFILATMSASEISGSKTEASRGGADYWVIKLDTNGNFEWDKTIGGNGPDQTESIVQGRDGSYVVTGWSQSNISGDKSENKSGLQDFWYAKIKVCGNNVPSPSNYFVCLGSTIDLSAAGGISYSWTGPNGFTSTQQNPSILNANASKAGQYRCNITEQEGCSITKLVDVSINNQPLPTLTSPQSFCIQQNASLNNIAITGQNIKWYDTLTTGNLLSNTTPLQNNRIYYASQTINSCESERIPVTINIQNTLAPTGNTNQTFCSSQNPTIANIQVNGNSIKWYDAINNGSLLVATTNLQNGKTYYVSQTVNNCESSRLGVLVSIVNTPSAPTGNTNQAFCKNQNTNLSNIQIAGQNIKWYDSNLSTTVLPNTTLLENNKTYYASQTVGCESVRTAILVQINDTALPTGNSSQQFCIDENATIANLNVTGTNLKWYDSAINGNILQQSTLQNAVYYATQTLNNCESERYAVTVKVQDTQIPIADSPQVFCIQKNALIRDIDITGQNIKWYDGYTSSVNLTESTLLVNGITYYASQLINNCESERIPVTIDILNATASDCINLIDELPYPKFFTPNNDGFNDHWTIDFAYLAPKSTIKIFDRYGKIIKELTLDSSWDGTYNGYQLPATDYWFVVTRANGKEFRSHFSLKR